MRNYVYFSLFLYLTLAQCGYAHKKRKEMANVDSYETNQGNTSECSQRTARKKQKLLNGDNPYQMTMVMEDEKNYQTPNQHIVIYHECEYKESVNPFYASYTAINCKSALWVVRKINDFINLNMLIVESTFDKELEKFAKFVWSNVDRFISILLYFLEKNPNSSIYMDKSVLKAFVSFKIKISLLISRNYFVETGIDQTQGEIIELLLVEIVELQRYTSVHCDYTTVRTSQIPNHFKVWVFVDGPTEDDVSMEAFLHIAANTGMEPDGPLNNCHARQILLEDIVGIRGTDEISSTVLNMMSQDGGRDGHMITIRQIVDRMLVSYDVDLYSWYHDSVLLAIMNLLCNAALTSDYGLSDVAKKLIDEINKKILADKDVLPAYFTEGFDLLHKNDNTGELKSYFDRLRDIHVQQSTDIPSVGLGVQLLERILKHFDQITCAEKYLKHLRGEYDKYFTPGSHNRNTLLMDYSEADESAYGTEKFKPTACTFVVNIYIHAMNMSDSDEKYMNGNIPRAMKSILNYCNLVILYERKNWLLVRTAYDVAVLLGNQQLDNWIKMIMLPLYKRLMNRVMSELNVYRTKYCRTATHEYLAIEKNVYKKGHVLWGNMQNFFTLRYDISLQHLEPPIQVHADDKYFRVDHLYETYVKKSDVVKQYSNVVRMYWNLRLLSVDEVFAELTNLTLDPRNVYALYDVYNKFFLAVIYYKVRRVLLGSNYSAEHMSILTMVFDFNHYLDIFPDGLAALKTDLSTIFSFPYTSINSDGTIVNAMSERDAVNKLRKAMWDVEVKFIQFNFVIEDDIVEQPSTSNPTPLEDYTFLAVLADEVLVRGFNEQFQRLRRFY